MTVAAEWLLSSLAFPSRATAQHITVACTVLSAGAYLGISLYAVLPCNASRVKHFEDSRASPTRETCSQPAQTLGQAELSTPSPLLAPYLVEGDKSPGARINRCMSSS